MKLYLPILFLLGALWANPHANAQIPRGTWIPGATLLGRKSLDQSDFSYIGFNPMLAYAFQNNLSAGIHLPINYNPNVNSGDLSPTLSLTKYYPFKGNALSAGLQSGLAYSHYFDKPENRKIEALFFGIKPAYSHFLSKNIIAEIALPIRYNTYYDSWEKSRFEVNLNFSLYLLILPKNEK
ncbi:hypothetical protein MASR2M44_13450 [Bacteroidota bacterium]